MVKHYWQWCLQANVLYYVGSISGTLCTIKKEIMERLLKENINDNRGLKDARF